MIRKILFADDDQILKIVVEKRLAHLADRFEIIMANDGFDALKLLEHVPISVICLDLKMPRMDGQSLLQHLAEYYPDIPVLIISSVHQELVRPLLAMDAVVGFLQKPFDIEKLGNKILELLDHEAQSGVIRSVSPVIFMQLMEMEGKNSTIRMLDNVSGAGAILYLSAGKLLDARVGKKTGIEAAYEVFSWDEVTVFFRNECKPRKNVINSELQSIIMGALAAKDEQEPSDTKDTTKTHQNEEIPSLALQDLSLEKQILESTDTSEFLKKVLKNKDGITAIRHDDTMTEVLKKFSEIGELSGIGSLQACYLEKEKQNILFVPGVPSVTLDLHEGFPVEKFLKDIQQAKK